MNFLRWARTQWDRVSAWALIGLGALFVVVGWVRVGEEALTAQQVPYIISGGIGGLFLLGIGAMLWLSADLRDEWRKLDAIERQQAHDMDIDTGAKADDGTATPAADAEADPFAATTGNGRQSTSSRRRAPLTPR